MLNQAQQKKITTSKRHLIGAYILLAFAIKLFTQASYLSASIAILIAFGYAAKYTITIAKTCLNASSSVDEAKALILGIVGPSILWGFAIYLFMFALIAVATGTI